MADDPMAGNEQGEGIGCAGTGHGTRNCRSADRAGNLPIRSGRPSRDLLQRRPYLELKGCRFHVKSQAGSCRHSIQAPSQSLPVGDQSLGISAQQRIRILSSQFSHQQGLPSSKHDRGDTALSGSDQQEADWCAHACIMHYDSLSARPKRRRRHAHVPPCLFPRPDA